MKPTTALLAAAVAAAAVTASADDVSFNTVVRDTAIVIETTRPIPNTEIQSVWLEGLVVTPTHTFAAHEWKTIHHLRAQLRFEWHPLQLFAARWCGWLRSFMQSFRH